MANGNKTSLIAPVNENITFTWSEGTSVDIFGNYIPGSTYCLYRTNSQSLPSGNPTVTVPFGEERTCQMLSPDTVDQTLYYRLAVKPPQSYPQAYYYNTTIISVTAAVVERNSSPALTISANVAVPGAQASLNWTESVPGENSELYRYRVQRSTNGTTWTTLIETPLTSITVTAPTTGGNKYYYRVIALGWFAASNSDPSNVVELLANVAPTAPTVETGLTIFNMYPRILITMGTDSHTQSVSATGFTASRASGLTTGDKVLLHRTGTPGSGSTTITATDVYGESAAITSTWEYVPLAWTDYGLWPGTTLIKAIHINELRDAFDAICDYYGLDHTDWGDPVEAGVTSTRLYPGHITQLQQTAERIADYINNWDSESSIGNVVLPAWTDPATFKAACVNELRQAVTLL